MARKNGRAYFVSVEGREIMSVQAPSKEEIENMERIDSFLDKMDKSRQARQEAAQSFNPRMRIFDKNYFGKTVEREAFTADEDYQETNTLRIRDYEL